MSPTTWKDQLEARMERLGDDPKGHMIVHVRDNIPNYWREEDEVLIEYSTTKLDVPLLTTAFNSGYGGTEGAHFTVWTERYVYFPVQYDGSEWVGHVPRHPDIGFNPTRHVGG